MIMNILCYGSSLTLPWLRVREENFESQETTPFFLQQGKTARLNSLKDWNTETINTCSIPNRTEHCADSMAGVLTQAQRLLPLAALCTDTSDLMLTREQFLLTIFINCVLSYVVRSYALMTSYIVQYVHTQISHIQNQEITIITASVHQHCSHTHIHTQPQKHVCMHADMHTYKHTYTCRCRHKYLQWK